MSELTLTEKRALEYINNTVDNESNALPISCFDDEHLPIGPDLREQLVIKGHIIEKDDMMQIIK